MSMTSFDTADMWNEMGICPTCKDHIPCGCNMTDDEFETLKDMIEDKMDELEKLQSQYKKLTGRNFVKPLRLAPRK
jgi:hypothetical protein